MNHLIIIVALRILTAAVLASGAVYLAYHEKDGWGWCLFCSVMLGDVTGSTTKKEDKQ